MGMIGCPEMLVANYQPMPRNTPKEQGPQLHHSARLRSQTGLFLHTFLKQAKAEFLF
jgi:hypothetical protein